jgi:hypothetical protein
VQVGETEDGGKKDMGAAPAVFQMIDKDDLKQRSGVWHKELLDGKRSREAKFVRGVSWLLMG